MIIKENRQVVNAGLWKFYLPSKLNVQNPPKFKNIAFNDVHQLHLMICVHQHISQIDERRIILNAISHKERTRQIYICISFHIQIYISI